MEGKSEREKSYELPREGHPSARRSIRERKKEYKKIRGKGEKNRAKFISKKKFVQQDFQQYSKRIRTLLL